jgi:dolichol-phosphate mannosyltransferase
MSEHPTVSFVIPAFDEAQSLAELDRELRDVIAHEGLRAEIVWVDDGSADDSWRVMERLCERHENTVAIRLRRNFGKTAALAAGVAEARGDVIVTLDADGQDVPAEVPRLLACLADGADVANGWKRPRADPWTKVLPSRVFNRLVNWSTGLKLHDHNTGLKAIRREVFDEVALWGNMHRFLPVLAHQRGFRVEELPVSHRPRRYGRSKYGAWRFVTGLLDIGLVRLLGDVRGGPQRLLGVLGLFAVVLGGAALAYLAAVWFTQFSAPEAYTPLADRPLLFYGLGALLVGAQLLTLGVLAGLLPALGEPRKASFSVSARAGRPPVSEVPPLRLERGEG